ncbi:MAG: bifunctional [glutamate--ammonia ligase]-adenylyl-L-tyrosine phosphorylase/[glutamate--ammonia-ligase] adenylyltransferase [Planctomycetes bacterium]|nr:bifunctional [glutamate--ammonia ligase]-adenylyl-L-tyrosine phosphorylase/[glutamate--ammonia-ligase] adenylyltransferase [Planctomycetota bacterium]
MAAAIDVARLLDDPAAADAWGRSAGLADPAGASRALAAIARAGVPRDLLGSLACRLADLLPNVADPDRVLVAVERFVAAVRSPLATAALFERDPRALEILLGIFAASPYLAELVIADPEAWEEIRVGRGRPEKKETLAAALAAEVGGDDAVERVARGIRRFKRRQTLRIAYGDIVEQQRLETVVQQISHVADCVVDLAVRTALTHVTRQRGVPRGPDGRPATVAAIALGKLGGGELNYSSDIDLVFVHSADGRVEGPRPCTNQEFFDRVVQDAVRLIADPTEHGAAYRVDLRLRPHGSIGPASMALEPMLHYFDQAGRTWERQAWVKARCVGGDLDLGGRLLEAVEPWIWRRWLTRADISGIKALKRRIEQRAIREGGDATDVKSGRGGIRDVEFTIQFLQLLSGGDTPRVRTGTTLEAIRRLAEADALTDQEREILERTYTLLRTVEHRLQILYDRQTHTLPTSDDELARLASRLGYGGDAAGRDRLQRELAEATALNRRILDHLLHDAFPDDAIPEPEVDLVLDPEPDAAMVGALLSRHGFRDASAAHRALVSLGEEKVRFLSTRRCRHFLAAIAPRLLAAIARTPDPDATLTTLAGVADSLGGKGVLWELFSFHPPSLDLTVRLCSSSPFLANLLTTNPGMIDELLDSLLIERLPTSESLDGSLAELCRGAVDIDPILQAFKSSQQLRVGVRDMLGRQDAEATTSALTGIAEALVKQVVAVEMEALTGRLGQPRAADGGTAGPIVLAMGKFGGREMNYASDVDVVFLYDHEGTTVPARRGRKPAEGTSNAHFFGELAQRTMRVFNVFGPHGRLYEMDSRLRPSGRNGPAATSLAEFARYFAEDGPAAVWERQALVKARPVVGAAAGAAEVRRIIDDATYGRSWTAADVESIRRMRFRMEEGATPTNLKRGPGGVVDIEFIAQMLQLVHGGREPRLRTTGTLSALVALREAGLLGDERFAFLERAYRTLRAIEGRLRLLDAPARHDFPESNDERRKLALLLGYGDTESLVNDVRDTTCRVRAEFNAVFDEASS